jgi:two-component system response regulator TtrR
MTQDSLLIYVVDDDEVVRRSYGMLLLARGHPVRLFDSGENFLASVGPQSHGCVILDLRMGGMSGLEVFQELRRRASPLVVLFLSGHGDIPTAVQAVQTGAFGWLEKPCNEDQLMRHLQGALAEAGRRAEALRETAQSRALWSTLTEREQEVALLVAEGKSSKQVARVLSARKPAAPITHRTVETHRGRVFDKLSVTNSNELLLFLQAIGLSGRETASQSNGRPAS